MSTTTVPEPLSSGNPPRTGWTTLFEPPPPPPDRSWPPTGVCEHFIERVDEAGLLDERGDDFPLKLADLLSFCAAYGISPASVLQEMQASHPRLWSLLAPASTCLTPAGSDPANAEVELPLTLKDILDEVAKRGGKLNTHPVVIQAVGYQLSERCLPLCWLAERLNAKGAKKKAISKFIYYVQKYWTGDHQCTDLGNARRLVGSFGEDIRYCPALGWMVWDGRRWRRDESGAVMRLAKSVAESWWKDAVLVAAAAEFAEDKGEGGFLSHRAHDMAKHGKSSESASKLKAMVEVATTEPSIPVVATSFDADPFLLNVANGTIDLRTGLLRPHDRRDLITRLAPVVYDASARFDRWDRFLVEATGGDADLEAFLQRAAGYTLTGDPVEEVLFLAHGPGAAGKSTFVEAVKATLGDYAATADFESFTKRRGDGGIRNDIARLASSRMVISIEVDEGKELAQGLVKSITGGDTVSARFLFKEFFEFVPSFTIWLVANHAPEVDEADDAMWRRIRIIPFTHAVPPEQRDPTLKPTLKNTAVAGPAILAWLVQGCLAWQRHGLGIPKCVSEATAAYRESMDVIGNFIDECCVVGPGERVQSGDLYPVYRSWADRNGEIPLFTQKMLASKLKKKGFVPDKVHGQRGWRGVGLKSHPPGAWAYPSLPSPNRGLPSG